MQALLRITLIMTMMLGGMMSVTASDYLTLDKSDPIEFHGDRIVYEAQQVILGEHAFFVDGSLDDATADKYPYVYNSLVEALQDVGDGSQQEPMVLYIAPYVYWIDDPDDPEIRLTKQGEPHPFGMTVDCEWLKFYGLNKDARNVVVACDRGQTIGAIGNYTMFRLYGDGISTENITFGNYCNIDLDFPLNPSLSRQKRSSTITQAQISFAYGDKLVCRNTRFMSRLNLCPMVGSERILFDRCHFETTDDALNGRGVYLNCTFAFYGNRPSGHTEKTGMVFLNCDMKSFSRGRQYLVKSVGTVTAVDTKMSGDAVDYFGWRDFPEKTMPYYYSNISFNGDNEYKIDSENEKISIPLDGKDIADAYYFYLDGKKIYNIYNLLKGSDDWDPQGMKVLVEQAQKRNGKRYVDLATMLVVTPVADTLETGKGSVVLSASSTLFGEYEFSPATVEWSIDDEYTDYVKLNVTPNGDCEVVPTNGSDVSCSVVVNARTREGLEAACELTVLPLKLPAPQFVSLPKVKTVNGRTVVAYRLDTEKKDESEVTWYRIKDADTLVVAVTRMGIPQKEYVLTEGDRGAVLMAVIAPKSNCSDAGKAECATSRPISVKQIKQGYDVWNVDLCSLPLSYQPEVVEGGWSVDSYAPYDTAMYNWAADNSDDAWFYGNGFDGSRNQVGLVQNIKGARLRYTPVGDGFGDMKISFTAVPAKSAGQGFSSAMAQYMDIYINFDNKTMSGYALRLIRTTKYHDATDFVIVRYRNGIISEVSDHLSTTCYRPSCNITIETRGDKLVVHADTDADYYVEPNRNEVVQSVDMQTKIEPTDFGGFGFQHTGTVRGGSTTIQNLRIEWK